MKPLLVTFLLTLSCIFARAQETAPTAKSINFEQHGSLYINEWTDAKGAHKRSLNLSEQVSVIVEFKEAPLVLQKAGRFAKSLKTVDPQTRFSRFSTDLMKIANHSPGFSKTAVSQAPQITHKFYKAFFGVAVSLPRGDLAAIKHLDYVKDIYPDYPVKAYLNSSVTLIRADEVWSQLGSRGEGVLVGELDTGIDYTHPALGGGLGAGFKVIGGYDLVNNDDDPMDDNGHGTHVAGIIAADSDSLRGVAPGAKLMAFKVLNASGVGTTSLVVAGIERALDPNQDGDFSDHVDIVNISLGSSQGSPDDPKCTAIDNATALGVTFCISAGNNSDYYSIGSPGMARSAITVGASTLQDGMADFSSKGPDALIFSIKPEVVAPGSKILSTFPGGKTAILSGTSMAAPHVTGCAALIKSLHPAWTPAEIKSALMTTAKDLGRNALIQGSGRIDALDAARAGAFAIPAQLSFGLDEDKQPVWVANDTIIVENKRDKAQTFTISANNDFSANQLTIQPSVSDFTLGAGGRKQVVFTLSVTNNRIPYRSQDAPFIPYDGVIKIDGEYDHLHLPWAFVKFIRLKLVFEEPVASAILSGKSVFPRYAADDSSNFGSFDFIGLGTGIYDLLAFNIGSGSTAPRIFVKENFSLTGSLTLNLGKSQAPHLVNLNGADENGDLLSAGNKANQEYWSRLMFVYPASEYQIQEYASAAFQTDSLYISDISGDDTLFFSELYQSLGSSNKVYLVQYPPFNGLNGSLELHNQSGEFISQPLSFLFPADAPDPYLELLLTFTHREKSVYDHASFGVTVAKINVPDKKWQGTLYMNDDATATRGATVNFRLLKENTHLATAMPWFYTKDFRVVDDSVASFYYVTPSPVVLKGDGKNELRFGEGPLHPDFLFDNSDHEIAANIEFRGPLDEDRYDDGLVGRYEVYDDNDALIDSGFTSYPEKRIFGFFSTDADAGRYHVVIKDFNAWVGTNSVKAIFDAFIDTRRNDANPAMISSLDIINSKGLAVNRLQNNETGLLRFSAADYNVSPLNMHPLAKDSTRAYYRENKTEIWTPLDIRFEKSDNATIGKSGHRPVGTIYTADLAELTQAGEKGIDLRIHIQDEAGNISEWTLEPGFVVGDKQGETPIELPKKYQLFPNFPNPYNNITTISYELPGRTRVRVIIYDILGRKVSTIEDKVHVAGKYKVQFNAQGLASGLYFYQIKAGGFTKTRRMLLIK